MTLIVYLYKYIFATFVRNCGIDYADTRCRIRMVWLAALTMSYHLLNPSNLIDVLIHALDHHLDLEAVSRMIIRIVLA